jgi:hypothetical protein
MLMLLLSMMAAVRKFRRFYHCKASLTDCCHLVYVRAASGDWSPLNLRFVIVAVCPLKVGRGRITAAAIAFQNRKISELREQRLFTSKF